ncbi:MAG: T9SS type A sorting domain-containing protein [bacterium]|nr:T9SS type A sorting domain-containing protein [bacterium]
MRNFLSVFGVVILTTGIASAQIYYPMHIGDRWVQQSDTMYGAYNPVIFTKTILTTDSINGKEYFQTYQKISGGATGHWSTWIRKDSTGVIMGGFGDSATGPTTPINPTLLLFPKEAVDSGYEWDFYSAVMGGHYHYLSEGNIGTVTVPAGTFNNCYRARLIVDTTLGSVTDTTRIGYYYYAPDVGEIRNQTVYPANQVMNLRLTSYKIGIEESQTPKSAIQNPKLKLSQNPFAQSTIISYFMPSNSNSLLTIYDVTGKLVKTLVNEKQSSGTHNITLNAGTLSSGIYFVILTTDKHKLTKKLVVMK